MFNGLEHTAIASPNPRALAEWYAANLEFVINFEYDGNFFVRAKNGSLIEIIPSEGQPAPQKLRDPGIRHFAIEVDDFDQALADLKTKNITFVGEPFANQGNRLAFFNDLDGNFLHLIKRPQPLP